MTTAKQKLQAAIDVAKNATQGRLHIGHVDENLDHAYIDTEDLTTIAEVYRRWDQVHFCNAAPSAYMQLAECAILLFDALEQADLRFMAMGNATEAHGLPSKKELISMCEESALEVQKVIKQVAKKLEGM